MPLKKLMFKPGLDRETTRYTSEGGWYECDKIRFRSGSPEKIGGWEQVSNVNTFQGTCRSLWPWSTFAYAAYLGVGTNLKYYIMYGGSYNDITPIRGTATLTNPFTATNGSAIITVADVAHGCEDGDFVTFSGATGLGGNITSTVLNAEYQVTVIDADSYTITATATANATDAAGSPGGGTVTAAYQLNVGNAFQVPLSGWGGGAWGLGVLALQRLKHCAFGTTRTSARIWSLARRVAASITGTLPLVLALGALQLLRFPGHLTFLSTKTSSLSRIPPALCWRLVLMITAVRKSTLC